MADVRPAENRSADFDTGGGTDLVEISGIVVPASGGAIVVGGTAETTLNAIAVGGGTAHSAVDAGHPIKIGGKAIDVGNIPASVSAGDRVDAWFGESGQLAVMLVGWDGVPLYNDQSGSLSISGSLFVAGGDAHDSPASVNPILTGLYSSAAVPSNVSGDGDIAQAWGDRAGRQVITQKSGTATLSNVASSATNVTVLAANTSRLGATVHNDSTQVLYLKMGTTASATSFTVKMAADSYYEVPFGYTGRLDGLWASANGNARVTELS